MSSFHNVYSKELVDEQGLTYEQPLLNSIDLVLSDQSHKVQSGREDATSDADVLIFESKADVVVLR